MTSPTWKLIQHKKLPANETELQISELLENMITALVYNNFSSLDSMIMDDAVLIMFKNSVPRNKEQFFEVKKQKGPYSFRRMRFKNVDIQVEGNVAKVFFTRSTLLSNFHEALEQERYYELEKFGEVWKVAKMAPVGR